MSFITFKHDLLLEIGVKKRIVYVAAKVSNCLLLLKSLTLEVIQKNLHGFQDFNLQLFFELQVCLTKATVINRCREDSIMNPANIHWFIA